MPTDAERARKIVGLIRSPLKMPGQFMVERAVAEQYVVAALATVRSEATAAAEQRIADLTRDLRRTSSDLDGTGLHLHACVEARGAAERERDEARERASDAKDLLERAFQALTEAKAKIADLTRERDEWRQAAQVEAGLVNEFKERVDTAEAEVDHLKEQNADQYKALKKKWEADWRAHSPDEAKAHDIIKRAAALLQQDRERADAAEDKVKRLNVAADMIAKVRDAWKARAESAEPRLARALEALERAGERLSWFESQLGKQSEFFLRDRAHAYAEEVVRSLADNNEPDNTGGENA